MSPERCKRPVFLPLSFPGGCPLAPLGHFPAQWSFAKMFRLFSGFLRPRKYISNNLFFEVSMFAFDPQPPSHHMLSLRHFSSTRLKEPERRPRRSKGQKKMPMTKWPKTWHRGILAGIGRQQSLRLIPTQSAIKKESYTECILHFQMRSGNNMEQPVSHCRQKTPQRSF